MSGTPEIIKEAARELRQRLTPAETILWDKVRAERIGVKFYRQKPIFVFREDSGLDRYIIADFYSAENKLIIELDGSVHNLKEVYILDKIKEKLLVNRGFNILRFTNDEVLNNIESVLLKIKSTVAPCSLTKE